MAFNPLLAIGMQIARENSVTDITDFYDELEKVMLEFIDGKISKENAIDFFIDKTGSTKAIDRVAEILSVEDSPLPPSNEKFIQSYSNAPRKKARSWTEEEDTRLLAAIHKFGLDAWSPVTAFVGSGRTRAQCSQRWFRGLDPRISKVLWTADEEARLIHIVQKYGDHSWTKVANALGNRSDAQCRYHYYQLINIQNEEEDAMFKHRAEKESRKEKSIPLVASAPSSELKEKIKIAGSQKMIPATQSFKSISYKSSLKLPPITELLKQNNNSTSLVDMPILKLDMLQPPFDKNVLSIY